MGKGNCDLLFQIVVSCGLLGFEAVRRMMLRLRIEEDMEDQSTHVIQVET